MSDTNSNCDGSGPCILNGEVRVLPIGDGNAILCRLCFHRETKFQRNRAKMNGVKFKLPTWGSLKPYGEEELKP